MSNDRRYGLINCLVTRPAHQTEKLNHLLIQAGINPVSYPTIAVIATNPTPFLRKLQQSINDYDVLLFVSRNAVDYSFNYLDANLLPDNLELGVIGKGTWLALKNHGVESHVIPADSYNSEGLLASPNLQQVRDKRILIMRGQQGRNLLGNTLRERGARVEYCEVYRRVIPEYPDDAFAKLTVDNFPDVAIFTSTEGLKNCFQLLSESEAQQLRSIPWLLISERMRETACDLGHNADIIIAHSASDEGILQALLEWRQTIK